MLNSNFIVFKLDSGHKWSRLNMGQRNFGVLGIWVMSGSQKQRMSIILLLLIVINPIR